MKIFISENIQWPMEEQGITPAKLAEAIGWSPTNIYPILNGKRSVSRKTAQLVADLLGVGVESIVEYDVGPDEIPKLEDKKEALLDKVRWNDQRREDARLKYERIVREHARLSQKYGAQLNEIVDQLEFLRGGR